MKKHLRPRCSLFQRARGQCHRHSPLSGVPVCICPISRGIHTEVEHKIRCITCMSSLYRAVVWHLKTQKLRRPWLWEWSVKMGWPVFSCHLKKIQQPFFRWTRANTSAHWNTMRLIHSTVPWANNNGFRLQNVPTAWRQIYSRWDIEKFQANFPTP